MLLLFFFAHLVLDLRGRGFVRSIHRVQSCGFESFADDKRGV